MIESPVMLTNKRRLAKKKKKVSALESDFTLQQNIPMPNVDGDMANMERDTISMDPSHFTGIQDCCACNYDNL
jgi:hypothetical protein